MGNEYVNPLMFPYGLINDIVHGKMPHFAKTFCIQPRETTPKRVLNFPFKGIYYNCIAFVVKICRFQLFITASVFGVHFSAAL